MSIVCGVDGCTGGWYVVIYDLESRSVTWRGCQDAREFLNIGPAPDVIAVDIPIGLPNTGSRLCDRLARKLLGAVRGTSVFPAPLRPMLLADSYHEACTIGTGLCNKKISRQTWNLFPKVRDVDNAVRSLPELRRRIREVHPELSFYYLAGGRPIVEKKSTPEGQARRLELLRPIFGDCVEVALRERRRFACDGHDVLDAFISVWTASRIMCGESVTVPASLEHDATGLPMVMFA